MNDDSGPKRTARPLAITPAGVAGTLLLIVVAVACVRLGIWQLARLDERRALNAGIAARLEQEPISDISRIVDTAGTAYRTATARGTYDNDRYLVLPGRAYAGVPGVHLIMPLRLAGRADAVLVNRGWIPAPDAATINARDFAVRDSVTVRGLVLPFPGSGQSLARRDHARPGASFTHVLYRIDEAELRAQFPYALADVMLQELDGAGGTRYPTQLAPPPLDEGPHLGYAVQWFAFALIGVIGWFALVLHSRPTRKIATPAVLLALLAFPAAGAAQLRPLEPLEWRIFDDHVQLIAGAGVGVLWDQPAPLAGTRGTLVEIGNYSLTFRSARMAVQLGGTALWRITEHDTLRAPAAGVAPSDGVRQDAGGAFASTAIRLSPDRWPADLVLRFGATVPATSDESGLDRDRTDFFALLGARYRRGSLSLMAENGVGINGTILPDLPQSDVWTYAFGAAYGSSSLRLAADFVGRQDGHAYVIRGNEDMRELRAGFDIGRARWLRVRYVHGFDDDASPAHGLRVTGGIRLYAKK